MSARKKRATSGRAGAPSKPSLSAVLPVGRAGPGLRAVAETLRNVLLGRCERFEIILADEGTAAETAGLIEALANEWAEVRSIRAGSGRGRGAALRRGFRSAQMPLVFQMDPDGGFVADEVGLLLAGIREADVVVGFRRERRGTVAGRVGAWCGRRVLATVFGVRVRDPDCGFRVFRRGVLQAVRIGSDGWFADAEVLAKANAIGYRVDEVGVSLAASAPEAGAGRPCCALSTLREAWRVFKRPDLSARPKGEGERAG